MKRYTLLLALFLMVMGMAPAVWAQENPFYIKGFLGGALENSADAAATDPSVPPILLGADAELDRSSGFSIGGAVGYEIWGGLSVEGELAYRTYDFERAESTAGRGTTLGDGTITSVMANLLWEPQFDTPLLPYIGAGVGFGFHDATLDAVGGVNTFIDGTDESFAYQGMAGVSYHFTPRLALYGGYRYFATEDFTFDLVTTDMTSHILEAGIRFDF